ncbi:hypothetical protein [Calothrix sp. UHCC 0171]|uniref:hypothetical protein n=1 Tax=Calothrix sp. UHCC 0171 TaxID=3110245 RepID=UPI002B210991|nr:hypothetical protein [Calothrix sp. UHCC 0171]MEA5573491.1 hypothetical protein [Calothrix sp. UHCC 0171]
MMNSDRVILDGKEKDIRVKATIWMWGLSVPLFFACVPIIALSDMGISLPFFVLIALALGTASIWFFYGKSMNVLSLEIKQLQERIIDLETIASHEGLDNKFRDLEQTGLKDCKEVSFQTYPQYQPHNRENTPG